LLKDEFQGAAHRDINSVAIVLNFIIHINFHV